MIYCSKIILKKQKKKVVSSFHLHSFGGGRRRCCATYTQWNQLFLFSFVVLLLKLNNWKGKKRETLLLFLKVLILVYERERGSRRPSHSKSSDRSLSLHDPILIYLSWAKCPPKTIGSWNPSPPQLLPFLELLYYITFSNEIQSNKILNQHIFLWQHQREREKDGA